MHLGVAELKPYRLEEDAGLPCLNHHLLKPDSGIMGKRQLFRHAQSLLRQTGKAEGFSSTQSVPLFQLNQTSDVAFGRYLSALARSSAVAGFTSVLILRLQVSGAVLQILPPKTTVPSPCLAPGLHRRLPALLMLSNVESRSS